MASAAENSHAKDVIDEHLFVEALALTAFEISFKNPQPDSSEKIVLLMERMNHSGGPVKVQKAWGRTRFGQGETGDML